MINLWPKTPLFFYYFEKETQQIKPIHIIKCLKIETSYKYLEEN